MKVLKILPALILLFSSLLSYYQSVDKPLAGVKITLDAGHGGGQYGAVSVEGLKEKDVNRAVVNQLKKMLEASGAEVRESRVEDEDVSLPQRTKFHKEWGGDLFVSVHHNANAEIDRSVNRSEVYYHFRERQGPSRDLAYETVRRLKNKLNLPGSEAKVIHAYHVLRENNYPAILGEAGYLSSPEGEKMFADPEVIRLEAEGYYEAIVDFFTKGWPEIQWVGALVEEKGGEYEMVEQLDRAFEQCPVFIMEIQDEKRGVDPYGVRAWIDDEPADLRFDPKTGQLRFSSEEPLPSGKHQFRVIAQNTAGRYGLAVEKEFTIQTQPAVVLLEVEYEGVPNAPDAMARGTVRVWDRYGNPIIADRIPVAFAVNGGDVVRSDFRLEDGYALVHFRPRSNTVEVGVQVGEATTRQIVQFDEYGSQLHGWVGNLSTGRPIPDARVELSREGWSRTDRQGWYTFLLNDPETVEVQVMADGYWPKREKIENFEAQAEQVNMQLQPMFGGVLLGRHFVLDPEFGGWEPGQVSKTGLRAADVNLRAAFLTEKLLEAAGAEVELTRREDATMSDQDRVRFGLKRDFDWFITIRHAEPRPGHNEPEDMNISRAYAKWGDARRLAQVFPAQMQEVMDTPGSDMANSSTWEVMHGSNKYQIIGLSPLFMTAPGAAKRLEKQAVLRKEAQAILYGLVEYYTFVDENGDLPEVAEGEPSLDERIRRKTGEVKGAVVDKETGIPLSDVLVGVEEVLWTATEGDGRFSWKYLDPGNYSLRFQKKGYEPKVVTVELPEGDVEAIEVKLRP